VRRLLDAHGLRHAESHVNEWNINLTKGKTGPQNQASMESAAFTACGRSMITGPWASTSTLNSERSPWMMPQAKPSKCPRSKPRASGEGNQPIEDGEQTSFVETLSVQSAAGQSHHSGVHFFRT